MQFYHASWQDGDFSQHETMRKENAAEKSLEVVVTQRGPLQGARPVGYLFSRRVRACRIARNGSAAWTRRLNGFKHDAANRYSVHFSSRGGLTAYATGDTLILHGTMAWPPPPTGLTSLLPLGSA